MTPTETTETTETTVDALKPGDRFMLRDDDPPGTVYTVESVEVEDGLVTVAHDEVKPGTHGTIFGNVKHSVLLVEKP